MKYLRLLRVKHYIKNGLVFLPLFFSKNFSAAEKLMQTPPRVRGVLPAVLGGSISSTISVTPKGIKTTRQNATGPLPRARSANGRRPVICALLLAGVCVLIGLTGKGLMVWLVPAIYLAINTAYSMGLKKRAHRGHRHPGGGVFAAGVCVARYSRALQSPAGLYLTVIAIAFYLGLGKRRGEILRYASGGRYAARAQVLQPGVFG